MRPRKLKAAIPRTVWALGFVSLFMDLSSELIHSLLPVFLVTTLGANALTVGVVEGIAEATALLVKIFSGALSDFFNKRKHLILLGYGLAALTKPLFPLAHSVDTVLLARFLDRVGKGIRGAPRDALIADVAPPAIRGACFGLRQSMDTVGAFLGPLLAVALLMFFDGDIKPVFWFAVIPAVIAALLVLWGVDEPIRSARSHSKTPIKWTALQQFSRRYWWVVLSGAVFTLARFSEAFLVLRAQQIGIEVTWLPLVMVVMSLIYALSAYPVGVLSDAMNKKYLLGIGLVLLVSADLVLAHADSWQMLIVGIALWGLHMGFSQGVLATWIAETSPPELKGTAFGLFNFVNGLFMFAASVIAGALWQSYGFEFTFYCSAVFALIALVMSASATLTVGISRT